MQICLSNTIIYADYDAASAGHKGRVDPGVHVRAVGLLALPHLPRLVQAPLLGRRGLGHQHVAVGGDMSLGGTDPPCTVQVHPRHGHPQEEERDQEEDLD